MNSMLNLEKIIKIIGENNMNENYTPLLTSVELYDNGIILDTEFMWCCNDSGQYSVYPNGVHFLNNSPEYPAPTLYELYKELPKPTYITKGSWTGLTTVVDKNELMGSHENPHVSFATLLIEIKLHNDNKEK